MNKRSLGALIVLNVGLLVALAVVTLSPQRAHAQLRGRGQFAMLSGRTQHKNSMDVVYVLNLNTGQVAAMIYESANDRLTYIDSYNFERDMSDQPTAR